MELKLTVQIKFAGSDGWQDIAQITSIELARAEIEHQKSIEDDGDCEYRIVDSNGKESF